MEAEVVNVIIAVAVIYFAWRWATGGGSSGEAAAANNTAKILGFKPRKATPEMVESVRTAFPDIPVPNIHYNLLRTGSVEVTVNTLLEKGYLDPPPAAYFRAFPPTNAEPSNQPTASTTTKALPKTQSLIQRFGLETKVAPSAPTDPATWDGTGPIPSAAKGKGRADTTGGSTGGSAWETTPEKRQESLQKRKEAMILAARRRLLEKEAASKQGA
ncbi:hypothetical protein FRC14_003239 [Serendipita sp. 396]|nr:hypothetical protein FRC14_003239 [Serendipita sp. 396]KAG8784771.1 hypothetical protein FRC15_002639 [Serendipita sp. 397]KAG8800555.1 hypothetical protein FRC16_002597 [Serendipita sp. 398]KAG8828223.1 hypothetical protein FRC19_008339 [Serendipita sp. 401]KAG8839080.1 hypothetical protein FRC18_000959 [Serendipita sp. 400]KAG8859887.1 hypothetical protein FRB91_006010 [Serendipita sp. 411]KAG8872718.1 hypothetical protein FRC20_009130 [Serendipita sp. 405]KAG9058716.1 hypothetical prot